MLYRILFILLTVYFGTLQAQNIDYKSKFSNKLANEDLLHSNKTRRVNVLLHAQFDYATWKDQQKKQKQSKHDRITTLVDDQKRMAKRTQGDLLSYTMELGAVDISSHWIVNCLTLTIEDQKLLLIASHPDVKWIGEVEILKSTFDQKQAIVEVPVSPNGRERGLTVINAHKMWALGYTGYGGLLFTADTGVDPSHPALRNQYRGLTHGQKSSWFDYEGINSNPYDCDRHGTHVTGTVLGLDRENRDTIGVAFDAQWIGGAILCGIGTADNIAAFEWALNPDGDSTTTDDIPHVINNSWYDPSLNGLDCYSVYVPILELMEAVGIVVIFSAGNNGPNDSTISQPHNINIDTLNSFTVGALNGNNSNLPIANFSSRGPSHCPGEGAIKIKPEVSAPGVSVRSCVRNGQYGLLSGTSMSAPHVSGAILLLRQAFPELSGRDYKEALYNTCRDLGDIGEDNTFGKGLIDVYAAYQYLIAKGNIPTSVAITNDIAIVNVQHSLAACNNQLSPVLTVINKGSDTLSSFIIKILYELDSISIRWEGTIAPGDLSTIVMDPIKVEPGKYRFTLSVSQPNGQMDERVLNNINYFDATVIEKGALLEPQTISDGLCIGSEWVTPVVKHPELRTTVTWFKTPFGDSPLPNFSNYVKVIEKESTLYAEVKYYDKIGPLPIEPSPSAKKDLGIIFDAIIPIKIDSILICAPKAGVRRFIAVDNIGDTIYNIQKYIKQGCYTIKFDLSFGIGKDYKLFKAEGDDLMIDIRNVTYPYLDKTGSMVVKGATDTSVTYPHFFNMKISFSDACGRTPFLLLAKEVATDAKAYFDVNKLEFYLPNDNNLIGTNRSKNASSYEWRVNDEIFSSFDLSYTFNKIGSYRVLLNAYDSSACKTQYLRNVDVRQTSDVKDLEEVEARFILYPNPSASMLHIEALDKSLLFKVKLTTLDGVEVVPYTTLGSSQNIDGSQLQPSIYIVHIIDESKNTFTQKWIKI
jgi:bacillopeptidase F